MELSNELQNQLERLKKAIDYIETVRTNEINSYKAIEETITSLKEDVYNSIKVFHDEMGSYYSNCEHKINSINEDALNEINKLSTSRFDDLSKALYSSLSELKQSSSSDAKIITNILARIDNFNHKLGDYKSLSDSNISKISSKYSKEIDSIKVRINSYNDRYSHHFTTISNRLLALESSNREFDKKFTQLEGKLIDIDNKLNYLQHSLLKHSQRKWWRLFR